MVELLRRAGLRPFGTFHAVVGQTLFPDGFTVIASGPGLQKAGISIPSDDPGRAGDDAKMFSGEHGIIASIQNLSELFNEPITVCLWPKRASMCQRAIIMVCSP
jgi:hypothetical protein